MTNAPPSTPLPETLGALRLEASLLQGLQSTMAILGAMPLLEASMREFHIGAPVPLTRLFENAGSAGWLLFPEGLVWAWWAHEVHHALCAMKLRSRREPPRWLWSGALVPPLGWFRRWVGMDALVRGADLEQLPAVRVPVEQAGGFRDDVVTWATLPAASRPRLALWKGLWSLGFLPFHLSLLALIFVSGGHHLLDTAAVALFFLPMLSGRMLVSGVTASVEELARRYEHQRATGAGTEPVTRSTLR